MPEKNKVQEVPWVEGWTLCPKCERDYLREPKVWNSRDKHTQEYICKECSDAQDMYYFVMGLRG